MSTMRPTRAPIGTAALEGDECSQEHCERTLSTALVEVNGSLRVLCRYHRKHLWGVSS